MSATYAGKPHFPRFQRNNMNPQKSPRQATPPYDEDLLLSIKVILLKLFVLIDNELPPGNDDRRRMVRRYLQGFAKYLHDKVVALSLSYHNSNATDNREKLLSELPELSHILTDPNFNRAIDQALADAHRDCSMFAIIHYRHLVKIKRAIQLLDTVKPVDDESAQ